MDIMVIFHIMGNAGVISSTVVPGVGGGFAVDLGGSGLFRV